MTTSIKKLLDEGFAIHLLKPNSKRPVKNKWSDAAIPPWKSIKAGLDDGYNVGVRLGKPSKVEGGYLYCIDLDIRDADAESEAKAALKELFGPRIRHFPTVKSGSGGPSRHFYFCSPEEVSSRKLETSTTKFTDDDGKSHWTWEIELFGTGKQVALPPSIHPDTSKEYIWLVEPDFSIGLPEIESLTDIIGWEEYEVGDADDEPLGISYADAEDMLAKLDLDDWCEDREGWRNVGMALHHEFDGAPEAFDVWCDFSKQSRKFDKRVQKEQWRSFGRYRGRPLRMATIKEAVKHVEIREAFDDLDDDEVDTPSERPSEPTRNSKDIHEPPASLEDVSDVLRTIPDHLLTVPGKLGLAVDYFNAGAVRPQPQFAVQTALALGSVILGRYWVTTQQNYTSLYFLNLGVTGSGKEHVKTTIENILQQAGLLNLSGPPQFTSSAGVFHSLIAAPRMISISDEFGRYLKSSRESGDSNRSEAQSTLMELWGRAGGVQLNKGYSAHGQSKEVAERTANLKIVRPALTMLGMSTPTTFYEAMSNADVSSGFLNRLIVVESFLPRMLAQDISEAPEPSPELIRWCQEYNLPMDEEDDIQERLNESAEEPIEANLVNFTPKATKLLRELDLQMLKRQNTADFTNMADMWSRARETIMRLSLIVALSDESMDIRYEHVIWARDYIMFYQEIIISQLETKMGISQEAQVAEDLLEKFEKAGSKGLTMRDINYHSRAMRQMNSFQRREVMSHLHDVHGVKLVTIKTKGRSREAYVLK